MQLHLTVEEIEVLRRLVEDEKRLRCDAVPLLPEVSVKPGLEDSWQVGRDLVGRGLSRNLQLGCDELEDLADALVRREKQLTRDIKCLTDPVAKNELERELFVLDHFLEKVTEACAMV
ncbi:MAG TPA: hypothetical protein VMT53_23125 [Terriglobales bacterium]|nr:hypothetical protein [Terriglobales bacterium]